MSEHPPCLMCKHPKESHRDYCRDCVATEARIRAAQIAGDWSVRALYVRDCLYIHPDHFKSELTPEPKPNCPLVTGMRPCMCDLPRCPVCNYTEHDKAFETDHAHCNRFTN